jgi:hypothetical protein
MTVHVRTHPSWLYIHIRKHSSTYTHTYVHTHMHYTPAAPSSCMGPGFWNRKPPDCRSFCWSSVSSARGWYLPCRCAGSESKACFRTRSVSRRSSLLVPACGWIVGVHIYVSIVCLQVCVRPKCTFACFPIAETRAGKFVVRDMILLPESHVDAAKGRNGSKYLKEQNDVCALHRHTRKA